MDKTSSTHTEENKPRDLRLLLFSLADYWSVLEPLLLAAAPRSVCEIGVGSFEFTKVLLDFCGLTGCSYCGIDPVAEAALPKEGAARALLIKRRSLEALADLPPQDVYFVDGDHNYYTVLNELRLIRQHNENWPLVILHDVGWPCGRRDHYWAPASIPEAFRHPCFTKIEEANQTSKEAAASARLLNFLGGLTPHPDQVGDETKSSSRAIAGHEGGPRNGVLTAIEDFIGEQPANQWRLLTIPTVFGLGIIYAPGKCPSKVSEHLGHLEKSMSLLKPLLELLERNRLDLLANHLGLHRSYKDLHAHSESLLVNYRELEYYAAGLKKACEQLERSAQP